jgi:hypothetical protein
MASSAAHLYHHQLQQRSESGRDHGRREDVLGEEWEELKRLEEEGWEELDFFTGEFKKILIFGYPIKFYEIRQHC